MFLPTNFELSVLIIFFFEKEFLFFFFCNSSDELNSNVQPGYSIKETRVTFIKTLLKKTFLLWPVRHVSLDLLKRKIYVSEEEEEGKKKRKYLKHKI